MTVSGERPAGDASAHEEVNIAIIGGGIVGIITALALLRRGYKVTVYERAPALHEIGAAFAFTGVARRCMELLDPRVLEALRRVGEANRHPQNRYWDGYHPTTKEQAEAEKESMLFSMSAGELDYWGCLRSHFLHALASELPEGVIQFSKQLESYVDKENNDKVTLHFTDGTSVAADAVIGCDGIHSSCRRLLLGKDHPASQTHYSHKVVYRALIPISDGISALGEDKANNQCSHMGPDAHLLSFPVNNWTVLNIFVFLHDPQSWQDRDKMTVPGERADLERALQDWSPGIRELISYFPEQPIKWGIFDTADHPAPTYANGRVCLAGDAAHATTPFHGAGAGMGVEDSLALVTALDAAVAISSAFQKDDTSGKSKAKAISAAFKAYSEVRLERSQWLVQSSRDMGDMYEWRYPSTGQDPDKCKAEFEERSRRLWDFNVENMVGEARSAAEKRVIETD